MKSFHKTELHKRYLQFLHQEPHSPSLQNLTMIIEAHLQYVPFENLSKLYYLRKNGFKGMPDFGDYLDGISEYNFGGSCYALNYYFNQLLNFLGYNARVCGAEIKRENSHMVNLVALEGKKYLVDVGYGAPFLKPLPVELDRAIDIPGVMGNYILYPVDRNGNSRLVYKRRGKPDHGYLLNPQQKQLKDFHQVIRDSYKKEAVFMNSILLAKHSSTSSVVIHNFNLWKIINGKLATEVLKTADELYSAIKRYFNISKIISKTALKDIVFTRDPWG